MIFFYFSEDKQQLDYIRNTRYWDLQPGNVAENELVDKSPSGKPGKLLFYCPPGTPIKKAGYSPEHQEWVDCGGWWLGWERDNRPTPETLQRKRLTSGYEQTLNDGNVWVCPVVRRFQNQQAFPNVPMVIKHFKDAEYKIESNYEAAWDLAERMYDKFRSGGCTVKDFCDAAVDFLSLNYRCGVQELSSIEALTTSNVEKVVESAFDVPMINEWLQDSPKKKQETCNT